MVKLGDCGCKVSIKNDDGNLLLVDVIMTARSPRGSMAIFDNIWEGQPNDNMENKVLAVRAFMEFSNGGR